MSYMRWFSKVCRCAPVAVLLLVSCSIVCLNLSLYNADSYYSLRDTRSAKSALDETVHYDNKQPIREQAKTNIHQKKINSKGSHLHTLESSVLTSPLKDRMHQNVRTRPAIFTEWQHTKDSQCIGKFVAYLNQFAILQSVVIDMAYCHGPRGGELIDNVLNQAEENEHYQYRAGCFQLNCHKQPLPSYDFSLNYHLSAWMESLNIESLKEVGQLRTHFTIAITRYEYANLYHTMTDWYNLFLVMQFFNQTQVNTNVLLLDGHPYSQLDGVWGRLVANVSRVSSLKARTRFSHLAWGIPGYNSLIMQHEIAELPLIEQFRIFFLASYSLPIEPPRFDCSRHFAVTFLWRRDYLAHPRNPLGIVQRKISNEKELLAYTRKRWPWAHVHGTQLDMFHMHTQLRLITNTDVLIGMHGAGLTHAIFLPPHAAVIEIKPPQWEDHEHFEAIARWRHLHYTRWLTNDEENVSGYSKVPVHMIDLCLGEIIKTMCGAVVGG